MFVSISIKNLFFNIWAGTGGPGARSVGGRRSSAATREKTAPSGIACCAQGPTLGLQDDTEGHSFFARGVSLLFEKASARSAAYAPGLIGAAGCTVPGTCALRAAPVDNVSRALTSNLV